MICITAYVLSDVRNFDLGIILVRVWQINHNTQSKRMPNRGISIDSRNSPYLGLIIFVGSVPVKRRHAYATVADFRRDDGLRD